MTVIIIRLSLIKHFVFLKAASNKKVEHHNNKVVKICFSRKYLIMKIMSRQCLYSEVSYSLCPPEQKLIWLASHFCATFSINGIFSKSTRPEGQFVLMCYVPCRFLCLNMQLKINTCVLTLTPHTLKKSYFSQPIDGNVGFLMITIHSDVVRKKDMKLLFKYSNETVGNTMKTKL